MAGCTSPFRESSLSGCAACTFWWVPYSMHLIVPGICPSFAWFRPHCGVLSLAAACGLTPHHSCRLRMSSSGVLKSCIALERRLLEKASAQLR